MEAAVSHLAVVSKMWPNRKQQISSSPYPKEKLAFSHPNNRDQLTIRPPSRHDNTRVSPTPSQAQNSPLLTILPPEIRCRIWQYVLGGKVIRLRLEPGNILHFQDYFESGVEISESNGSHFSQSHLDLYNDLRGMGILKGVDHSHHGYEISAALLRVCRFIYLEASHILYRQNIFFMESDVLLHVFQGHHHRQKNFARIRHLRLYLRWPRPHEPSSTWELLWAGVAAFELASLGVHIVYDDDWLRDDVYYFYSGIETPAVLPLLDVRGIDVVRLVIRGSSMGSKRRLDLEEEIKQRWQRPASINSRGY